jgi:hypothetical protein
MNPSVLVGDGAGITCERLGGHRCRSMDDVLLGLSQS